MLSNTVRALSDAKCEIQRVTDRLPGDAFVTPAAGYVGELRSRIGRLEVSTRSFSDDLSEQRSTLSGVTSAALVRENYLYDSWSSRRDARLKVWGIVGGSGAIPVLLLSVFAIKRHRKLAAVSLLILITYGGAVAFAAKDAPRTVDEVVVKQETHTMGSADTWRFELASVDGIPAESNNAVIGPPQWPMIGGDARHTSRSPFVGPDIPEEKWSLQLELTREWKSPVIGTDGTIYVGSNWRKSSDGYSGDGYMYAIRPNGSEMWHFESVHRIPDTPAIGPDGTIYLGTEDRDSDDGYLYAIRPDGSLKWRLPTRPSSSPAISPNGTIYIASGGNLHAIAPDGSEIWIADTGGTMASIPAIGSDGTIYMNSGGYGILFAIAPDGCLKWRSNPKSYEAIKTPTVADDGTIYVGSYKFLHAVEPDGSLKLINVNYSCRPTTITFASSPPVGSCQLRSADGLGLL